MPSAVPNRNISTIVDSLNEMKDSGQINEVLLRRYENEAEKLKDSDPSRAFTLLGMISCVKGDIEKMRSYHLTALKLSDDSWIHWQFSVSLRAHNISEESYHHEKIVYERDLSDINALDALISSAAILEEEDELELFLIKWKELTGKEHESLVFPEDNDEELSKMLDVCDQLITNNPDLVSPPDQKIVELANELVRDIEA